MSTSQKTRNWVKSPPRFPWPDPKSSGCKRPHEIGNWVNWLFKIPWCIPCVASLFAVCVFLGGLLIAFLTHFAYAYLHSLPVYIACVGTGWVTGCVRWGLKNLPSVVDDLRVCFPDQDFELLAEQWIPLFGSMAGMFFCAIVWFVVGAILVYIGLSQFDPSKDLRHVFGNEWYIGNFRERLGLIYFLGFWASLAGGAGTWLFVVNVPFLFQIGRVRAEPMPTILLAQFRSASDFYLMGTTSWFVGVALTVSALFRNLSPSAVTFLLVCSGVGLTAFLWPQYIFHRFLVKAQSHIAALAVMDYKNNRLPGSGDTSELGRLSTVASLTTPGAMWVYDLSDVAVFLVSNGLAPFALILKASAESYLSARGPFPL